MSVANDLRTDARVCREGETLAAAGHQVCIVSMAPAPPRLPPGLDVVALPQRGRGRAVQLAWQLTALSLATVRRRADVYHAHNVHMLPAAWLSARLRNALLVYDAHELFAVQTPGHADGSYTLKQRAELIVERALAPRADAMITASHRYATQISESLGVDAPIAVPNYPPLPTALREESPLRAAVGAEKGDAILLYQGGFYLDTRALDVVIEAISYLPARYRLALLGFGPPSALVDIDTLIERSGVSDRVRRLPSVPFADLPRWTAGADIGIIPFKLNSAAMELCSPNKLYEYMGAGVPVVSSAAAELLEVLEATNAGLTYDWWSAADLVRAVRAIADEPRTWTETSNRARNAAVTRYNWESAQHILLDVYSKLARERGGGEPACAA